MEKWRKFCSNSVVKMVCVLLFVVSFLSAAGSTQWFINYIVNTYQNEEALFDNYNQAYEKTAGFGNQVQNSAAEILDYIAVADIFESGGKFDDSRVVDVKEYYESGTISGKSKGQISYKLSDLLQWGKGLYGTGSMEQQTIIVCQEADEHYTYMTVKGFQKLLEENGYNGDDYKYDDYDYSIYAGEIYDDSGDVLYEDVWTMDIPKMPAQPLEGDWLEIFNENDELNGSMSEYISYLDESAYGLYTKYRIYKAGNKYEDRSKTNLIYMLYNPETKKIYTNNPEWDDAKQYQSYLDEMKKGDAYLCYDSVNWDTNLNVASYDISDEFDSWIFGFQMDTGYPVHDTFQENANMYNTYAENAEIIRFVLAASIIICVLCIIILTFGFGRTSSGPAPLTAFDRVKTEIGLVIILAIWGIIFGSGIAMLANYRELWNSYLFCAAVVSLPTAVFFLIGYASLIKRIKAHTLWKNSILYLLLNWMKKPFIKAAVFLRDMYIHMNLIWKACLIMIGVIILHWAAMAGAGFAIFLAVVVEAVIFAGVVRRMIGEQKLLKGMRGVTQGNLEEKIDTKKMKGHQKEMAELLNHVEDGMQEAMEKQMRSERMKTELITNVSHDIKTPLTSIINYVDLLKRETGDFEKADPKKVEEYLEILDQKSQRLKVLTEDVVEASKISSGNISLENTKLDLVEALTQIEGEYSEKLEAAGLKIVRKMPEPPVTVYADGRRIWRVFGNLYQNTAKYAMPDTRVYVSLVKEGTRAVFTMKNISEAALNIDADELTERFIRGDESRTTEGSGLGLSIAKSLTEAMKGTFSIYLDGDLFKVTVAFPIVND